MAVISFIVHAPGACTNKKFYGCNFCRTIVSYCVCHCHSLPPVSNICGQGQEPPFWSPIRSSTLVGSSLSFQTHVSATFTNTLAYYKTATIMAPKSFIVQAWNRIHNTSFSLYISIGPIKQEGCNTLGQKGLVRTNTLDYWTHL